MTVKEAYDLFIHDRKTFVAPATLKKYTSDLQQFFKFLESTFHRSIKEIDIVQDKPIFQDYVIFLRNRNIRPVTIRSYCRSIKAFLRYLYDWDYCPDYLKRVKLPKDDASLKIPLYCDEVSKIDATFDFNTELGRRNYCIFHLMLDCGLRRQEVVHLQMENILHDKNVIQILDSKGNKSRMTLIPDFILDALANYCFMTHVSHGYIFLNRNGSVITDNTIKQFFQDLKASSGITRVHAHLLRHTFATSYLLGGGNLEFLRVFLGHSDYEVTKTYSHMAAQMRMLGADIYRLDSIFFTRGY